MRIEEEFYYVRAAAMLLAMVHLDRSNTIGTSALCCVADHGVCHMSEATDGPIPHLQFSKGPTRTYKSFADTDPLASLTTGTG